MTFRDTHNVREILNQFAVHYEVYNLEQTADMNRSRLDFRYFTSWILDTHGGHFEVPEMDIADRTMVGVTHPLMWFGFAILTMSLEWTLRF